MSEARSLKSGCWKTMLKSYFQIKSQTDKKKKIFLIWVVQPKAQKVSTLSPILILLSWYKTGAFLKQAATHRMATVDNKNTESELPQNRGQRLYNPNFNYFHEKSKSKYDLHA